MTDNGPNQWTARSLDEGEEAEAEFRADLNKYYGRSYGQATIVYPDCWDEDQKALDELLSAVHGRSR